LKKHTSQISYLTTIRAPNVLWQELSHHSLVSKASILYGKIVICLLGLLLF